MLKRERGAVIVLVAISLTFLLGVAAFAVDLGYDRQVTRHQQAATDAGSLAGALELPNGLTADPVKATTVRATTAAYTVETLLRDPPTMPTPTCAGATCTYVVGGSTITVTSPYTPPEGLPPRYGPHNFVLVRTCEPNATFFGRILGGGTRTLCREAVARNFDVYDGFARGLIALDPTSCQALEFEGSSETNLHSDGAVVVESSCANNALDGGGAAWEVEAGLITVVGGYSINPCTESDCFNGTVPIEGVAPQGDPLAVLHGSSLSMPVLAAPPTPGGVNPIAGGPPCTVTYHAGRYTSELTINNNQVACFEPGLYWLEDGFHSNGNAELYGTGVLFYIAGGDIDLNGSGALRLDPVAETVPATHPLYLWRGISIFQAYGNTNAATINGNNSSSIGTIYLPDAHLDFQGNASEAEEDFVTGQVIARTVTVSGSGYLSIDAEEPAQGAPPAPDVGLHR